MVKSSNLDGEIDMLIAGSHVALAALEVENDQRFLEAYVGFSQGSGSEEGREPVHIVAEEGKRHLGAQRRIQMSLLVRLHVHVVFLEQPIEIQLDVIAVHKQHHQKAGMRNPVLMHFLADKRVRNFRRCRFQERTRRQGLGKCRGEEVVVHACGYSTQRLVELKSSVGRAASMSVSPVCDVPGVRENAVVKLIPSNASHCEQEKSFTEPFMRSRSEANLRHLEGRGGEAFSRPHR